MGHFKNFNLTNGCWEPYLSNTCEIFQHFIFHELPAKFLKYKSPTYKVYWRTIAELKVGKATCLTLFPIYLSPFSSSTCNHFLAHLEHLSKNKKGRNSDHLVRICVDVRSGDFGLYWGGGVGRAVKYVSIM